MPSVHAICVYFALAQGCARPAPPPPNSSTSEGRSTLVAAYADDPMPGVRARVVCKVTDVSPSRWSDVVLRDEATVEACELVARAECEGHGDVVRGCAREPLGAPLVPRGVFVLRHALPQSIRYETFTTREECESAARERPVTADAGAWLDAEIAAESNHLEAAKRSVQVAERNLAEARAAQKPDVPLLQLEVETLRRKRDLSEKVLAGLREQRAATSSTIGCFAAGGS